MSEVLVEKTLILAAITWEQPVQQINAYLIFIFLCILVHEVLAFVVGNLPDSASIIEHINRPCLTCVLSQVFIM